MSKIHVDETFLDIPFFYTSHGSMEQVMDNLASYSANKSS
jgi:hypothetical protein